MHTDIRCFACGLLAGADARAPRALLQAASSAASADNGGGSSAAAAAAAAGSSAASSSASSAGSASAAAAAASSAGEVIVFRTELETYRLHLPCTKLYIHDCFHLYLLLCIFSCSSALALQIKIPSGPFL